jgi:hypothetical protein
MITGRRNGRQQDWQNPAAGSTVGDRKMRHRVPEVQTETRDRRPRRPSLCRRVAARTRARYVTLTSDAPAPSSGQVLRFPIVGGVALLTIGVTLAWWSRRIDVSPLREGPANRKVRSTF